MIGTEELPTHHIGGLDFIAASPSEASQLVVRWAEKQTAVHVHLANAYTVSLADTDIEYRRLLSSGVLFPDGKPITWFSKIFRQRPGLKQVRGPQMFLDVLNLGRAYDLRHFFLGSTDETLELMQAKLTSEFPGLKIVGTYSPPFRPLFSAELRAQDELILSCEPDLVWVGLGTPKQDFEAERIAKQLGMPTIAVGAAFDFSAGTLRVAPPWMRSLGLEWLFRLITEPRRLWRRYLVGNTRFLFAASTKSHRKS